MKDQTVLLILHPSLGIEAQADGSLVKGEQSITGYLTLYDPLFLHKKPVFMQKIP
jgi:hypothetical protein